MLLSIPTSILNLTPFEILLTTLILLIPFHILFFMFLKKNCSEKVYLLDFACYKPPESQKCAKISAVNRAKQEGYAQGQLDFMAKIMQRAGLGDSTYLAEGALDIPLNLSLDAARKESEMVIFGAVDEVLEKTGVKCSEIGILIVNCTVHCDVPSFTSVIVNRYKMKEDICCYNMTGMGCSAGLRVVGLAKHLLQVHKNTCALIVSTENTTSSIYPGVDNSKFLVNCIFRVGGSAVILSNKSSHRPSSKYQLIHAVHTHTASSDISYRSIFREEDSQGITGVTINKDLLIAANLAIQQNLKSIGSLILPISEQFLFMKNYIARRLNLSPIQPYVPKFSKCVQHFLPHVGGKPVLDELQKNLGFSDADMEASVMTLHRFGNTSSSSIWYELAYAEAKEQVKKGDRVWQIAFGSGFKCSSVIWRALRDVRVGDDEKNPWMEDIGDYPVALDSAGTFPYFFESSKEE